MELNHERDAVLRAVTYHRLDPGYSDVRSQPIDLDSIPCSLQEPFTTVPENGLGLLDRLPMELLSTVCLHMGVLSHFRFRQVNRLARAVASRIGEYKAVATHGLDGLRSVLGSGYTPHVTIIDLYRTLLTSECTECGSYGGFLFLPLAKRCCLECIIATRSHCLLSAKTLSVAANLSQEQIRQLVPIINIKPTLYSLYRSRRGPTPYLVLEQQAIDVLKSLGRWPDGCPARPIVYMSREHFAVTSVAFPYYNLEAAETETGLSCQGCRVKFETMDL